MASKRSEKPKPALGKLAAPAQIFFLNPYTDARFTPPRCPKCDSPNPNLRKKAAASFDEAGKGRKHQQNLPLLALTATS